MPDVTKIAALLCRDLVAGIMGGERSHVATSMLYPNGDGVVLYFRDGDAGLEVSDRGATLANLTRCGIALTTERMATVEAICRPDGIKTADGQLTMTLGDDVGRDCLTFCQCVLQVAGFYYHQPQRVRSTLPREINQLVEDRIEAVRPVTRRWTDAAHDPTGAFPVDYHFNGDALPTRNLFHVTSNNKALLVSSVVTFLRSNRIEVPTMVVVDGDAEVAAKQVRRLRIVSDDVVIGLKRYRDRIVEFATGSGAKASAAK